MVAVQCAGIDDEMTRLCVCVCVRVTMDGRTRVRVSESGGVRVALNRGPSSPDLKRHSFIIANLPNINMRASMQSLSLSLGRGVTPP